MDYRRRNEDRTLRRIQPVGLGDPRSVGLSPAAGAAQNLDGPGYTEASGTLTVVRLYLRFDLSGAGLDAGRLM